MPNIVCDVDGVLLDCLRPALRYHGKHDLANDPKYPATYSWAASTGMSDKEFWDGIEAAGPTFWSELPYTSFGQDLLAYLLSLPHELQIATLAVGPNGAAGKYAWGQRELPPGTALHITTNKEKLSRCGWLLIDDSPKNVDNWYARGGDYVLVPAPYNANRSLIGNELEYIKHEVERLGYGFRN